MDTAADLAHLEKRIAQCEARLATHPDDRKAADAYLGYLYRYGILVEEGETVVTLDLPSGVKWQRNEQSHIVSQVRVIFWGFPRLAEEMSRADLAALLRTRAEVTAP